MIPYIHRPSVQHVAGLGVMTYLWSYYQQPEKLRVIMMGNRIKKAAAYKIQTATSTRVTSIIYAIYSIHFVTNKQQLAHRDH